MTYIKVGMLQPHAPSMCPSRIASTAAAPKKHPASKKNSDNTPNPIRWNEVNFSPFFSHATLNRSASCLLLAIGSWLELWDMSVMLSGHWLKCKRLSVGHGTISLNLPKVGFAASSKLEVAEIPVSSTFVHGFWFSTASFSIHKALSRKGYIVGVYSKSCPTHRSVRCTCIVISGVDSASDCLSLGLR